VQNRQERISEYIHLKINGTNFDLDFDHDFDLDFDLNSFCTLLLIFNRTRSRSPVTVEEWVAALPEENNEQLTKVTRERKEEENAHYGEEDEEDTLSLGAEAVLHIVDNHPDEQSRPSRTSATSLISSCCSRESFLQSREPDPEQVLLGLGFGGSNSVSAIPQRFLTAPSRARGVCVETFKRQQRVEHSRAEGGYLGYLGLTGSNRRPSVIVDRILQTFVDSAVDNDLQRKLDKERQMSREAPGNHVATLSSIPARFQRKDPKRPRFDQRLVTQALDRAPESRSLRQVAKKVAKQVFNQVDNEEDNQVENQKANLRLQKFLSGAAIEEKGLSTVKEEDCRITETNLTQKLEVSPQFEKIEEAQNTTETTHFPSEEMDVKEELGTELEGAEETLCSKERNGQDVTNITHSVTLPEVQTTVQSEASVLREVLRLALSDMDQDSKHMLMRHLDQGMGSRELYDLALSLPRVEDKGCEGHL